MTIYVVLEPEEWGMRWARPPVAERLLDPEVYVHHRAGNGYHNRDAADVFYEMNEAAIAVKGYSATDYDLLVHENTDTDTVTIGIARGQWLSAATRDRNEQGEAVCALGYFHPGHKLSERPSPGMLEGIARAIALTIRRGWVAPDASILGHRQNPAHPDGSSCPGDYLFAEMDTIRRRVAELLAPEPEPTPEPPEDDDMIEVIQVDGDVVQYVRTGFIARWAQSGPEKQRDAAELGFDPKPRRVDRSFLRSLTLVGPQPQGDGVTTSYRDFGGHA